MGGAVVLHSCSGCHPGALDPVDVDGDRCSVTIVTTRWRVAEMETVH